MRTAMEKNKRSHKYGWVRRIKSAGGVSLQFKTRVFRVALIKKVTLESRFVERE